MPLIDKPIEERTDYIGGSDISAVCGISRWTTPLKLWAEKTGAIEPDDLSDNESVQMGTKLEEFIANEFSDRSELQVRREPKAFVHAEHPFLLAHVDRIVLKDDAILECKNCSEYRAGEFDGDGLPIEMIYQTMWNMGMAGRKKGYLAALIGGNKFRWKEIEFDEEMYNDMVVRAVEFWGMVKDKTAPVAVADDSDTLFEMYKSGVDEIAEISDETADEVLRMVEEISVLKDHIDNAQKKQEENKNIIKQIMGEANTILTEDVKCTWKNQVSKRIDSKRLKEEKPEIYEAYLNETESRVFRYKTIEKKEN